MNKTGRRLIYDGGIRLYPWALLSAPRENPWLEGVELRDSAYPYHDWNERISAECYAPKTASRILDPDRRIVDIINNSA
jgi:hypothetical protein